MSLAMNRWQEDAAVFGALRTHLNDKLYVAEGRLKLEKGSRSRMDGVPISSDPSALVTHLEALIKNTAQECFQSLQQSKSDRPEYYEQIADFKRQFKCLHSNIDKLQMTYRSRDCDNKKYAERYNELYEQSSTFLKQVKEYKSSLPKPPQNQRPFKHIDYDERTYLDSIKWKYPMRVPVSETVAAAKKALSLVPKPRPLYMKCLSFIGASLFTAAVIGAVFLTALKIVLWNPIEKLIRGEVRTLSPYTIAAGIYYRMIEEVIGTTSNHQKAYQSFTTQLLHRPHITDEVVEAFVQLAPRADLLDLGMATLVSENISELAPYIVEDKRPGALPVATYLDALDRLCKKKNCELKTLHRLSFLYERHNNRFLSLLDPEGKLEEGRSIESIIEEDFARLPGDVIEPHCVNPYISPKALEKLLKAAFSSPTCREIELSDSLAELQPVRNLLAQHSYRFKEGKIYQRV